ncbi:MAG: redoxin family protein [Gammaproteobacteria bacterium]|nr:redoxin family protein [Gammaproteobacteria bacterium]MCP5137656.1 redoxin family protein [Gammaproteobacteria bacterium]
MFPFPAWLRRSLLILPLAGLIFLGLQAPVSTSVQAAPAPEFTGSDTDWLNGGPLDWQQLRGKVVLLDVWTFECWNCYRSFPWLNDLEARYAGKDFQVIGIHSPEFDREKDPTAVAAKMREFKLDHPVMLDNDFAYWKALGNRYWPAFYLVDKQGAIRYRHVGETHSGSRQARALEAQLDALLAED